MATSTASGNPAATAGAAFFDVDETLLSIRTLESFLLYYLKRVPMISRERLAELSQLVLELDRTEFNRIYFGIWAGQPAAQVREAGREWFAEASADPGFFRPNVLERLRAHQDAGDHVVLVSGSFEAPLEPLRDAVAADALYCTGLEVVDGHYTGTISRPMIGDDKRTAVEEYLAEQGAGAQGAASDGASAEHPDAASWGYGDHESDLALLEAVSNPVVVGSDPVMLKVAAERGWPVLPIDRPLAPRH